MTHRWIRPSLVPWLAVCLVPWVHAQSPVPGGAPPARQAGPVATPASPRATDRVELDPSRITGNRELPRVLYVVPWRQPRAGEVDGRPVNSLLYGLSAPVDRDVARRVLRYGEAASGAGEKPAP